jgi:hypothetical protein
MTVLFVLVGLTFTGSARSAPILEVGRFSAAIDGTGLPDGWKPLKFRMMGRETAYALVKDGDVVAVKAMSEAAASGLTREISISLKEYPVVEWRWKIANSIEKSDVTKKEGDDYPARLYIAFEYDARKVGFLEKAMYEILRLWYGRYPPLGAINYVWGNKEPKGTVAPSPYTNRVRMIVVDGGPANLNRWVMEERNVYEDYKRAFGEEPPLIAGVAIMTDTDNTRESATAYYGDIVFKQEG